LSERFSVHPFFIATKAVSSTSPSSLVLLHILPQLPILLDLDLGARVELVETPEIHVFLQKRNDIGIEGLPVGVLEMIPISSRE
jgi:hypothetical protein